MTAAKRARVDNGDENPFDIAARIYSEYFLRELGEKFEFNAAGDENAATLRDMAARYILHRRLESLPDFRKEYSPIYRGIKNITTEYLDALKAYDYDEINLDMQIAATQIADIDGREISDREISECYSRQYYSELIWLLELLKASTDRPIRELTSPPGPKINEGLEAFVGKLSDFWIRQLKQDFIIFHKKRDTPRKAGLPAPAFEFVKILVVPIDDISDTTIKTAMRKTIARHRESRHKAGT